MRKQLASAALASLLALFLSACATTATETSSISGEAQAALAQADNDVKEAHAKFAVWTTTEAAIKAAHAAAKKGDSATVIKEAHMASDLVKLGLAQKNEPLVTP